MSETTQQQAGSGFTSFMKQHAKKVIAGALASILAGALGYFGINWGGDEEAPAPKPDKVEVTEGK